MKPAVIPILCGAALAVMAGAGSTHFMSVRQMVLMAEANPVSTPAINSPAITPDGDLDASQDTEALIARIHQENASLQGMLAEQKAEHTQRRANTQPQSSDLNQVLAELVALNRDLQNQLAETTRDITQLEMRVDSHSTQFRPLRVTQQDTDTFDEFDAPAIGVLPPLE